MHGAEKCGGFRLAADAALIASNGQSGLNHPGDVRIILHNTYPRHTVHPFFASQHQSSSDTFRHTVIHQVTLNPGHRMNYHSHEHRDEVWTVMSGSGRVIVDGVERPVAPGDVVAMQRGCRHTIMADTELKVLEVQMGEDISVHDKQKFELED